MSYSEAFSLITKYNALYSYLPPSPILLTVFTPLSIRRGVGGEAFSLIPKYNYLYPPLPSSHILLAVFTPLSIRRGGGGEAVVGLVLGFPSPSSNPSKEEPRELFFIELSGLQHY